MHCPLTFYFNSQDPKFFTKTVVVNDSATNYIAQVFISAPIYNQCGQVIGSKVSNDIIQQTGPNQYVVNIDSIYTFNNQGTISWNVNFINNKPSQFYPINTLFQSNIVSATGIFLGKQGIVSLVAQSNGIRNVSIAFKN
jgi:hypothetical protein